MWEYFNPNPAGRIVGDCSVRAIAAALDLTWEEAFAALCSAAYDMCDMPSGDSVWGALLRKHGYYRHALENTCPDCYTAAEFARDHPEGVYVLAFGKHVATVIDGVLLDSWDSSDLSPVYYWSLEVT